MKYVKQFAIIMIVSFIGECLRALLPFKIPASVYGLVIMLLALMFGIIKLESVKDTAEFLVQIMPVLFVPPTVSLLAAWPLFKRILVPFFVISAVSTFVVMIVTGHVSQALIRIKNRKKPVSTDTKTDMSGESLSTDMEVKA